MQRNFFSLLQPRNRRRTIALALIFFTGAAFLARHNSHGQEPAKPLDPKAWGSNHAGQTPPDFVTGEECLFCHRNQIGPQWQKNAHGVAIRPVEDIPANFQEILKQPELAAQTKNIQFILGSRQHVRFLQKDGFGKFSLLNTQVTLDANGKPMQWLQTEKPEWQKDKFANNCAGCHTTAVNPKTNAFATFGHDCYACHGNVNLEHTNNTKLMLLSKQRRNEAQIVTAICAQCHLRAGKSQSTGLPYPNNFIAGDNLWQDFVVDWTQADNEKLNPIDRHVYFNARDVAVHGQTGTTCLSCHQVHYQTREQSLLKHTGQPRTPLCTNCHTNDLKAVKPYTVTSGVCEY